MYNRHSCVHIVVLSSEHIRIALSSFIRGAKSLDDLPICSVLGCNHQGSHKFPKEDSELCKKWVIAIKRGIHSKTDRLWTPTSAAIVCKRHFLETDFVSTNSLGKLILCYANEPYVSSLSS